MSSDIFTPFNIEKTCKGCGSSVLQVRPRSNVVHYGEIVCIRDGCSAFNGWYSKPKPEGTATKRKDTKGLIEKFGKGFCEMCLRKTEYLPHGTSLQAHHVIPKENGGDESKDNIWIVCTMCHKQIHHARTYLGHYDSMFSGYLDRG